jgi:hypothetical protein
VPASRQAARGAVERVCERSIVAGVPEFEPRREHRVPSTIVVANTEEDIASRDDQLGSQLRERVSASDVENSHFSSQLIERGGWARAEREDHGQLEE